MSHNIPDDGCLGSREEDVQGNAGLEEFAFGRR
jgi:hypothetical protein